jgi:type III pantothenate kinase
MLLCDIGNSFYHFYKNGAYWKEEVFKLPNLKTKEQIYTISVNDKALKSLKEYYDVVDISSLCALDTGYLGLGIDRAFACEAITDGVIVDAGSGITVDVVQGGSHLGGFILPGFAVVKNAMEAVSPRLAVGVNFGVDINSLPQNTKDAVSYGILYPIVTAIENASRGKFIYFTGGDGKFLSKSFENSIYDELLIFKGMQKALKREGIC